MPDLAVYIANLTIGPPNLISFRTVDSNGLESAGDLQKDFGHTVTQENTAIEVLAKTEHTAAHGTVFVIQDSVHIYGGRTV